MLPGDLVLTPNWAWHDHANTTDKPMIWLDGLDAPLVHMLEAGFHEEFPHETQPLSVARGLSQLNSTPYTPSTWSAIPLYRMARRCS